MLNLRKPPTSAHKQRGAVAIMVGLSMAVVVAFAGLALDSGKLYVNKTELQNASDACALAGSLELTGAPAIPAANFTNAENAGKLVASRNKVGFQANTIAPADVTVEFSTALDGAPWVSAATPPGGNAKYVRCRIAEDNIAPWFMQVLGFGNQTVTALATATLAPSQNNCTAIPLGLCSAGAAPSFGLVAGNWYSGGLNNANQLTGSFNWVDFSPPAGGASELRAALLGTGACTVALGSLVGQTGADQSVRKAWNTRFGIYDPSTPTSAAVPDRTGYGYRPFNWPSQSNALPNFLSRRTTNSPYGTSVANGNAITGLDVKPPSSTVLQSPALATAGGDRRLAVAPIVNCAGLASAQTVPVLGWGCVLMLHPMDNDPGLTIYMEYEGLTSAAGSPCATVGSVGNSTSTGPMVPALVQ